LGTAQALSIALSFECLACPVAMSFKRSDALLFRALGSDDFKDAHSSI
jgi:hypothetical protein